MSFTNSLKILFLGTGTSKGIPEIACSCKVCKSKDEKDKRLRSSVLLQSGEKNILIDCGPDFRQQMLAHDIKSLDAILITHEHYDHVGGLDDVRSFGTTDIYAQKRVLDAIRNNMHYSFSDFKFCKKLNLPEFNLHEITDKPFCIERQEILPINLIHFKLSIFGFRVNNFAYLTDFNDIPSEEFEKLKNLDVVVVDALRTTPHPSHNTLDEALSFIEKMNPKTAYLTHIGHDMGLHEEVEKILPENVFLSYDGLELEIK